MLEKKKSIGYFIAVDGPKHNIDIMNIYNNDNLDENVEKVISYIADRWRKV